ncbi:DUF1816 domain-containing protein [Oscillatoriales cyanobacterium LEGE 11467]|uniref:DUF1816 domain-containing protein n=1 Tax=Zarconia navalis LEGE 11467 TaxID=1828826 RepID=A0A928VWD8_9CYAN|nr:DUF1816 domain-containing protein [Zarconia navalis]MBE9041472.1 DUF1816 domain-containing protein [Zarconia navalis LEGE 11467]
MKEFLINLLNFFGFAWWVKVDTASPACTYYFGPFLSEKEAHNSTNGYVEDLEHEGAQGIGIQVSRCKPNDLTIYQEDYSSISKSAPIFSGQT